MDPEILKMIEEKRKKAQELRKRKMEERMLQQQHSSNASVVQPFEKLPKTSQTNFNKPNNSVTGPSRIQNPVIRPPPPSSCVQPSTSKQPSNYSSFQKNNFQSNSSQQKTLINNGFQKNNVNVQSPQKSSNNYTQLKDPTPNSTATPAPVKITYKISITLESSSRFSIMVDYQQDIIKIFKLIESRNWDPNTKKWSFSLEVYNEIMKQLKQLITEKDLHIKFESQVPDAVIQHMIDYLKRDKINVDLSDRLEPEFIETLFPYQKEGIKFGVQREGKLLIADDMGLGKTIQAIGLAKWYREDWPLLIVCPASLKYQWMNALMNWIPDLSKEQVFVANDSKSLFPKVSVTITSYDLLSLIQNRLNIDTNRYYSMIIIDESHYIKSDATQRSSTASLVARSCKRVVLLSGTPALSRPIELFPQLNIINKDLFPSKHAFGLRYCDAKQKTIFRGRKPLTIWDYKGSKNLDELKIILSSTIMIRRDKANVLNELPSKKREMILLSMDHLSEKDHYQMNMFKKMIKSSKKFSEKNSISFEWFAKSAELKVQAVMEYLENFLSNDGNNRKLLCFCHHMSMMDGLQEILNQKRINHIRIDGSTTPKIRQQACDIFQERDNFRIALLSITACSTGLNLTAASLVIFAETFWNPGVLAQAEDRVHRIGQKENVRVIYLLGKGTIDELIWPAISKKLEVLNKVGLSRDTFSNTHNPLQVDDNQSVLTEFINTLSQSVIDSFEIDNDSQLIPTTSPTKNNLKNL